MRSPIETALSLARLSVDGRIVTRIFARPVWSRRFSLRPLQLVAIPIRQSGRGRGIRVKCGLLDIASARPETNAANFVRIGFPSDDVGPRTLGRGPAGK